MRQRSYMRPAGIFVATVISTIAVFALLKNHFAEESNRNSDVTFTSSIPSRPVPRPPSVQLIQARPDDPMTAFLLEPRIQSREMPRELVPLPRSRPKRLWSAASCAGGSHLARGNAACRTAGPDGSHEPRPHHSTRSGCGSRRHALAAVHARAVQALGGVVS